MDYDMKDVKKRQSIIALIIMFVLVMTIVGSIGFTALGTYSVGTGVTSKSVTSISSGVVIDETVMGTEGSNLYIILFGHESVAFSVDEISMLTDTVTCEIVCVDNGLVVGNGIGANNVYWVSVPDAPFYRVVPYFLIDMTGVYKNTYSYKIVLSGDVTGESFVFDIIGDNDSPDYPSDGSTTTTTTTTTPPVIPTEPIFIQKPVDATYENITPSDTNLTWIVRDDDFATFEFSYNGTIVSSGVINVIEFEYNTNIGDLGPGVYVFSIVFTDSDSNDITDEVVITVTGEEDDGIIADTFFDDPMMILIVVVVAIVLLGGGEAKRRN
jgi:hypothetical protein